MHGQWRLGPILQGTIAEALHELVSWRVREGERAHGSLELSRGDMRLAAQQPAESLGWLAGRVQRACEILRSVFLHQQLDGKTQDLRKIAGGGRVLETVTRTAYTLKRKRPARLYAN